MKSYTYQNTLIGKKQLRQILAWSFTNYDSMQACSLADELKFLGFRYASQAGISISIEDLKIPFVKNLMLARANGEILNAEKVYLKGKITNVERFQKIIDTWSLTSEALKNQIIYYFKNYDPLNSVYIMAFSGARGNLSQVRQLVGMRGLMSDPSGQIMNLPIKKNFREGLTITDYLMSGYGARKGIVDTALKTANSGYLTRRLIDVAQDILIREKDCSTDQAFIFSLLESSKRNNNTKLVYEKILGRVLNKSVFDLKTHSLIAKTNTQITPILIEKFEEKKITEFYVRSPLVCNLYRAICQKCYGWDLANENLVDMGEAIGILAGQSIGEPGTQLTMRTFHTGGIFTSEARQQIISPITGVIQFHNSLKPVLLRTNRGEDVLMTKKSGSLIIIPKFMNQSFVRIEVLKNTILFPKNNQYIFKNDVIGELINQNAEIKAEIKPILSETSGEIFLPSLKQRINVLNHNKLVWILSGQVYNAPLNSFLNFYSDYKLNSHSYIFRTKIISHYNGFIKCTNNKKNLYQSLLKLKNKTSLLTNAQLEKLQSNSQLKSHLLNLNNLNYFVSIKRKHQKNFLQMTSNNLFGTLITNSFQTLTGGIGYYDCNNDLKLITRNKEIIYYDVTIYNEELREKIKDYIKYLDISLQCYLHFDFDFNIHPYNYFLRDVFTLIHHRSFIWLEEEIYNVNCKENDLLVEHGDFISKGFEFISNLFSKTSGSVSIDNKNDSIKIISIKSGLIYEGKKFKNKHKKVYYPGEVISNNIIVKELSFSEFIVEKNINQLIIRPIKIYEFPWSSNFSATSKCKLNDPLFFKLKSISLYCYKSNQTIKGAKNITLISNILGFKFHKSIYNSLNIELITNKRKKRIHLNLIEKLCLNNHIPAKLKYKNIKSCFLVQKTQFINSYNILTYLEGVNYNPLEIVKYKIKKSISKEILLISNDDCLIVKKQEIGKRKLGEFITMTSTLDQIGKIIVENNNFFIIQKGKPYFFPNCKNEEQNLNSNLQYKLLPYSHFNLSFKTNRIVSLNYYNVFKSSMKQRSGFNSFLNPKTTYKFEFSTFFLKTNKRLYGCLIPKFFKTFTVSNKQSQLKFNHIFCSNSAKIWEWNKKIWEGNKQKKTDELIITRTLLLQNSEIVLNKNKEKPLDKINYQLILLQFANQPFKKMTKSIGLYAITEDFFDQDVNSVFCKNTEFIEIGKTIGLLHLEKAITGDIVQGLPRIEEILEARKKHNLRKKIPTNKKKSLLIQNTNLDINFEFKKLGMPIKDIDKINPHKLLKVYFNYYGIIRLFLCDRTQLFKFNRLVNNYEGIYRSFKKVQLFILNSVQSIYKSQGVVINDKHLEVIIKQMTTKVLITEEGATSLLKFEAIDLYHIFLINKIIQIELKECAVYIPLLLGISKTALNNPSFLSAASFQETTKVLTKAAIEGRVDWLRGLKENIIIGQLIPAGTGSPNYRNCFCKSYLKSFISKSTMHTIMNLDEKI